VINHGSKFDAVCFDCDSTLSRLEGIDELARRVGADDEIAPLTAAAMDGSIPLDDIYAKRLTMIRPDRSALAWLGQRYIEETVPGARETVGTLLRAGMPVFIVSGGLLPAILPLSAELGILRNNVYAVDVTFERDGIYRDFDRHSPLARPDGKADICRALIGIYPSLAMVGDGVTDLAARKAGAYIVGFGGVAQRDAVVKSADVFIADRDLTATLDVLLRGPK
jgi:phosphoserine phosphatase